MGSFFLRGDREHHLGKLPVDRLVRGVQLLGRLDQVDGLGHRPARSARAGAVLGHAADGEQLGLHARADRRVDVVILAVWVCWIAWSIRLFPRPHRAMVIPLFVVILLRSVTESGLVDSTTVLSRSGCCACHAPRSPPNAGNRRGLVRPPRP